MFQGLLKLDFCRLFPKPDFRSSAITGSANQKITARIRVPHSQSKDSNRYNVN